MVPACPFNIEDDGMEQCAGREGVIGLATLQVSGSDEVETREEGGHVDEGEKGALHHDTEEEDDPELMQWLRQRAALYSEEFSAGGGQRQKGGGRAGVRDSQEDAAACSDDVEEGSGRRGKKSARRGRGKEMGKEQRGGAGYAFRRRQLAD